MKQKYVDDKTYSLQRFLKKLCKFLMLPTLCYCRNVTLYLLNVCMDDRDQKVYHFGRVHPEKFVLQVLSIS
jgi:hypothetical protein